MLLWSKIIKRWVWGCLGKQLSSSWLQWWGESLVDIRVAFDSMLVSFRLLQAFIICYFTSGEGLLVSQNICGMLILYRELLKYLMLSFNSIYIQKHLVYVRCIILIISSMKVKVVIKIVWFVFKYLRSLRLFSFNVMLYIWQDVFYSMLKYTYWTFIKKNERMWELKISYLDSIRVAKSNY